MDSKVKSDFLVALRDPKNKQAKGCLAEPIPGGKGIRHCANGLIVELAYAAGIVKRRNLLEDEHGEFYTFDGMGAILSSDVLRWAGLDSRQSAKLMTLNDSNKTFAEIADYVEENF